MILFRKVIFGQKKENVFQQEEDLMTKEEFEAKLNNIVDFDFEKNEPKYSGDSSPLEDIIKIQKEYIESLEKKLHKAELAFCVAHSCINRATRGCRKNCKKMEEFLYMIEEEDD